jgi:allophanate hydrolase subunit 2
MIVIEHVVGLATIQDLGRPGRMHEGLAPGGALVPELLVEANRSVGNHDGAPALELFGRIRLRAETKTVLGAHRLELAAGQEITIENGSSRVAYVAMRGGIESTLVLGGRGTQLSAGIGAPLRAGDRLRSAGPAASVAARVAAALGAGPIRVIPGPDRVEGALEALFARAWKIAPASDRVGTRLVGEAIPAHTGTAVSRPMVKGAIELPPDGAPIVLGPEHPTTGGYPVVAVIAGDSLGRLFATAIGGTVRFTGT